MGCTQVFERAVHGRHGPIAIREYRPAEIKHITTIVWLHGGGFSAGGLDQRESDAPARALAELGNKVVTVGYRLVPKWSFRGPQVLAPSTNRFPVPMDDVIDAYLDVAKSEGQRTLLGGASAGACLAAAAAIRLRGNAHAPKGLLLIYGSFHAELPPIPSAVRARVRGHHGLLQFRPETVHRMNLNYAGSEDTLYEASTFPGGSDLASLPPTLVLDADRDTLRASGQAFATELLTANVPTAYEIQRGSHHGFLNRPKSAHFRGAIKAIQKWIQSPLISESSQT